MLSETNTLNKFLLAVRRSYSDMDAARTPWPANASQIEAYFSDIIATAIFDKFKKDPVKCKKALSALTLFILYASLYHTEIVGLKVGKIFEGYPANQKDILDFTLFIFNVIRSKTQDDIFCLNGSHKVLTKKEIKEIEKTQEWTEAKDQKIKKEISNLIISLESSVWALYFDSFSCAGKEIHGSYQTADKNIVLIRDYFNLDPKEIWSVKGKYQSVRICLKYPKKAGIKLDYANHIKSTKPLLNELVSFSILVDGKQVAALFEIHSLFRYFSRLAKKQAERVNALPPLEILKKGAEIYYYRYKKFFEYYGEDWQPPQRVYNRINSLKLKWWKRYENKKGKKFSPNHYVKLFDPRNDFIG